MDFPVDVVYTWVDGKDPLWLAERACFLKKENINYNKRGLIPEPVGASLMSFSETELYYSIQSVKKYMSWVRKIYVVTPGHKPKESEKFQDIIFINQEDIIPKTVRTPIFNSNGLPSITTSPLPSRTCTIASNGAVCSLKNSPLSNANNVTLPLSLRIMILLTTEPSA